MNYGLGSYTQRLRQIRNSLRMAHQKELDPKNPRKNSQPFRKKSKPENKLRSLLKARTRSKRNQRELWTITTTCATRPRKSFQAPNNRRKDEFPVVFGVKPRRFRRCPGRIDRAQVSSKIWDVIGSVAYCFCRPFHPSD